MTCELICIGTELLTGNTVNTNAAYISKKLMELGIDIYHQTVVGDNPSRLFDAVKTALDRADLIITTGGLGPTYDDLSKETVADAVGLSMVLNEEIKSDIESYFTRKGKVMPKINLKQAYMPEGAISLANHNGTAPGVVINKGSKMVIMLPGPPNELCPMMDTYVCPMLEKMSNRVIVSRNINLIGEGESYLAEFIAEYSKTAKNPSVATYVNGCEVTVRITASAQNKAKAAALIDATYEDILKLLPAKYVYGTDYNCIEEALVKLLLDNKLHIATAESCTGGLISKRITDIPGASAVFECGICSYSNRIKKELLSVNEIDKYGVVSKQTAKAMAEGILKLSGADIAVSTTGLAGPDGGSDALPVGSVFIGIATKSSSDAFEYHFDHKQHNPRHEIRFAAATNALMHAFSAAKAITAYRV